MVSEKKDRKSGHKNPEAVLSALDHIPVAKLRQLIREQIRLHPNFVLIGETGSGKTTCLPPLLLELRDELHLKGKVGVTQPRRVATRSVTTRVSDMMGCEVGQSVGYHVRFEDQTTTSTDITFMTDGILLRKIQFDPILSEFSIIMVDEAHERSLNIDLCLGLLKDVNRTRVQLGIEPIRLVVTSATIERNKFATYISGTDTDNSVEIPGQMFPVEVFYENEIPFNYDFTRAAAEKVKYILDQDLSGDILIFMPGKREISDTIENITSLMDTQNLEILPLHAELSPEEQDRIFLPSSKRKIIISTNIAETSVTIDGIIHVIDTGLIKQTRFDSRTGLEQLILVEHALSGIDQRKGRAGRVAPGYCYRLFTESSLKRRPKYQTPEIARSNLGQLVLAMKKVGIQDVANFDFLDPPQHEAILHALKSLTILNALDSHGHLTDIGEFMVDLGIEPRLSRMIIEASENDNQCLSEICTISAFMEGKELFVRPLDDLLEDEANRHHEKFKKNIESDFEVILNIWRAYAKSGYDAKWAQANYLNEKVLEEAKNVRQELITVLNNHGILVPDTLSPKLNKEAFAKAITAGLIENLLQYQGHQTFRKVDGTKNEISLSPRSLLYGQRFVNNSLVISGEIFINTHNKAYASNCLLVKIDWLKEISPQLFRVLRQTPKRHNLFTRRHRHSHHF